MFAPFLSPHPAVMLILGELALNIKFSLCHSRVNILMDKQLVTAKTFDKYAQQYDEKYNSWNFYHDTYEDLLALLSHDARVFEFACGPGNICKYLRSQKSELHYGGIDLAPNMIRLAQANNPNCHFEVQDGTKFIPQESNYDAVIAGFYLPYIARDEVCSLFEKVAYMLRDDGLFYCSYASGDYDESGLEVSVRGDQIFMHYYQLEFVYEQLQAVGLHVISMKSKNLPLDSGETSEEHFVIAQKTKSAWKG